MAFSKQAQFQTSHEVEGLLPVQLMKTPNLWKKLLCKPRKSIRRAALEHSFNKSSIQLMLRRLIKLYPTSIFGCSITLSGRLECSYRNAKSLLHHYQHNPQLLENLWFSAESVFCLYDWVNRRSYRIWGKSNPKAFREHKQYSPKLVVWCEMSTAGLD